MRIVYRSSFTILLIIIVAMLIFLNDDKIPYWILMASIGLLFPGWFIGLFVCSAVGYFTEGNDWGYVHWAFSPYQIVVVTIGSWIVWSLIVLLFAWILQKIKTKQKRLT